ncbi:type II toxin-antitoxin system VapC family toxin [Candidatus Saccharibacteria bacterium]|nr:type II toxin-antitoxin system VapC family toxin [Candidatus Saccharibacteria bacterium]
MIDTFVLDTSAYSAFNRGDKRLKDFFRSTNQILIPVIVIGELRAGFLLGTKAQENEKLLQKLLDSSNATIVTLTDRTAVLFAVIFQRLRAAGTPINTNDMWIAALALEHDSLLLTLDSDFNRVPDLLMAKF